MDNANKIGAKKLTHMGINGNMSLENEPIWVRKKVAYVNPR